MPSGGARARSGPAPDPNALRRDRDSGEWTHLPAAGRTGDAPEWPLARPRKRELELWTREWARPQAVMWERNGQTLEVALYVRSLVDAEAADAPVAARTLVRQQMDALGLTVPGLRSNRWVIVDEQEQPKAERTGARAGVTARDRLKLVVGGDA